VGTGWVITLFILGLVLLFLEIVVPGGILGFIGIILLSIGIFMTADSALQGVAYVSSMLLVLGILIVFSFQFPQTRRFWKRFSLSTRQTNSEGYVAPTQGLDSFLGREGVALSQLRPSGTADFDGVRLDVVTEGGFIPKETLIKVIAVEGTRVIVREVLELEL
jgi:membrane-bound ClpP family serine protease